MFGLPGVDLVVEKVVLFVKLGLHVDVVSIDPLEIMLNLRLNLLVLLRSIIEIQMHVRDMLCKHFLQLAHAYSPNSTGFVDLWDSKEINLLRHLLQEFQLKGTIGNSLAQGPLFCLTLLNFLMVIIGAVYMRFFFLYRLDAWF